MNAIKDIRCINHHIFPKFIEESEDLEKGNFSSKTTSLQMMTSLIDGSYKQSVLDFSLCISKIHL